MTAKPKTYPLSVRDGLPRVLLVQVPVPDDPTQVTVVMQAYNTDDPVTICKMLIACLPQGYEQAIAGLAARANAVIAQLTVVPTEDDGAFPVPDAQAAD